MTEAVIATTPNAMVAAQGKLIEWVDAKLLDIVKEFDQTAALIQQLQRARMSTSHADNVFRSLKKRQRFYEKVKAALMAGYYIIPPFDCQIFALRTERAAPREDIATRNWGKREADARVPALPIGDGRYVHPVPVRKYHSSGTELRSDKEVEVTYYSNTEWKDVEFPVMAMKPELVEAAHNALEQRIFDALGIAPQYRAADPIIVGHIKHYKPNRLPLTFFVAWWLDRDQL